MLVSGSVGRGSKQYVLLTPKIPEFEPPIDLQEAGDLFLGRVGLEQLGFKIRGHIDGSSDDINGADILLCFF